MDAIDISEGSEGVIFDGTERGGEKNLDSAGKIAGKTECVLADDRNALRDPNRVVNRGGGSD